MIIFVLAKETLIEFLKGEETLEHPKTCPECGRRLWRHGKRQRICETIQMCARLEIPRMFCAACRKTFSILPSFLATGVRFERAVSERYLARVATAGASYRDAAWSDDDGEREDASASVSRAFRAVAKAVKDTTKNLLALHQHLLNTVPVAVLAQLEKEAEITELRSHSAQKTRQLRQLSRLLQMLGQFFGSTERAICGAYRSLCLGFRLPTPHCMQQQLF